MQRLSEISQEDSVIALINRSSIHLPAPAGIDLEMRFGKLREEVRDYERRLNSVWMQANRTRAQEITRQQAELEEKRTLIRSGNTHKSLPSSGWEHLQTLEKRSLERLFSLRCSLEAKKRDFNSTQPSSFATEDANELENVKKANLQLKSEIEEIKNRLSLLERQVFRSVK